MIINIVFHVRVEFQPSLVYSEIISSSVDVKVDAEEGSLDEHRTDLACERELLVRIHEWGKAEVPIDSEFSVEVGVDTQEDSSGEDG